MRGIFYEIPEDQLRTLAAARKSDREIARIFGCSEQVVCHRRKAHGIPAGRPLYNRTPIDITRVAELASEGWTDRQIAAELGVTDNLIKDRRREAGIKPGSSAKFKRVNRGFSVEMAPEPSVHVNVSLADAEFAKLMGDRRFSELKFKPTFSISPKPPSNDHGSVTGCAAAMCAG
jgi:hypothetical protein